MNYNDDYEGAHHAGPRVGPRHALAPGQPGPALPDAPTTPSSWPRWPRPSTRPCCWTTCCSTPRATTSACSCSARTSRACADVLPPDDVRRVRARHPRGGRARRGLTGARFTEDLRRAAAALPRLRPGRGAHRAARAAVEWAYIPHFYYNFYVFQYATSLAASSQLAQEVLAGKAGAKERYLGPAQGRRIAATARAAEGGRRRPGHARPLPRPRGAHELGHGRDREDPGPAQVGRRALESGRQGVPAPPRPRVSPSRPTCRRLGRAASRRQQQPIPGSRPLLLSVFAVSRSHFA